VGSKVISSRREKDMSIWQRWLHHPESFWVRKALFQIHLWVGVGVCLYLAVMSISGSVIVFRNDLEKTSPVAIIEWLVDLHENLLSGGVGRFVNGIGSACLISLCLTGAIVWWPGLSGWRRALTVSWGSRFSRFVWDAHSAVGIWSFFFVLMWGVSGFYFAFPKIVNVIFGFFDPADKVMDQALGWLSMAHFGRFGWFAEALWAILGLVLAVLSGSGVFLCCHRMIYKSSPKEIPR
jgi:uncharacterized iron-regulated membrane protein